MSFSFFRSFLSFAVFSAGVLTAGERQYLNDSKIAPIMSTILEEHVSIHTMTPEVLKRAYSNFIDQFDPDRTYYLAGEVEPYLNPTKEQLDAYFKDYTQGTYQSFTDLTKLTGQAILRARKIRGSLKDDLAQLVKDSNQEGALTLGLPEDESKKPSFAADQEGLVLNNKQAFIRFVASERLKEDDKTIEQYKDRLLPFYNSRLESLEKPYLAAAGLDDKIAVVEQNHDKALHILQALVASLDPHSNFFDNEEAYDMRVHLEKGFDGVGIIFQEELQGLVIVRLIKGAPAQKSGKIEIGDRLIAVDGERVSDRPYHDILDLIRGEAGTPIKLTIARKEDGKEKTFVVDLTRQHLELSQSRVDYEAVPITGGVIGVIHLHSFYEGDDGVSSEADIRKALDELNKKGKLLGVVLDLRDNLGGFLSQAVKVAGLFIKAGVVVIAKYSNGQEEIFRDTDLHQYYTGPLVVLTSKESASAAEIVAQALQDYGVAVVVGDKRTYGKGTVQHQTITDKSSGSYYAVTIGRFYTVSGKSTQLRGVQSDIVVPSIYAKEEIGEKYSQYPLKNDKVQPLYNDDLADLSGNAKLLYDHYYRPYEQQKSAVWEQYLPYLKERSAQRIKDNKTYQAILNESREQRKKEILQTMLDENEEKTSKPDPQLTEAENILKDMIEVREKGSGFTDNVLLRSGTEK